LQNTLKAQRGAVQTQNPEQPPDVDGGVKMMENGRFESAGGVGGEKRENPAAEKMPGSTGGERP
jgi:hypothetical protein